MSRRDNESAFGVKMTSRPPGRKRRDALARTDIGAPTCSMKSIIVMTSKKFSSTPPKVAWVIGVSSFFNEKRTDTNNPRIGPPAEQDTSSAVELLTGRDEAEARMIVRHCLQ